MNVETAVGLVLDMASGTAAPPPTSSPPVPDLLGLGGGGGAGGGGGGGGGGAGSGRGAGADDELWETPPLEAMMGQPSGGFSAFPAPAQATPAPTNAIPAVAVAEVFTGGEAAAAAAAAAPTSSFASAAVAVPTSPNSNLAGPAPGAGAGAVAGAGAGAADAQMERHEAAQLAAALQASVQPEPRRQKTMAERLAEASAAAEAEVDNFKLVPMEAVLKGTGKFGDARMIKGRSVWGEAYKGFIPGVGLMSCIALNEKALVHLPGNDDEYKAEARKLSKVAHPNLTKVLGCGATDPGAKRCLVCELATGTSLGRR